MMMNAEQPVEWELAGETEVFEENPPPVPLCPPQIPYDLTWARTRATAVGSLPLTASAMARPPRLTYVPRSANPTFQTKNQTPLSRNSKTNATRTSQNYATCPKGALFRFSSNGNSVNALSNFTLSKKRDGSRRNDTELNSLPQTVGNNGTCEDIDCGRPSMCSSYLFPTPNSQFQQPACKKISFSLNGYKHVSMKRSNIHACIYIYNAATLNVPRNNNILHDMSPQEAPWRVHQHCLPCSSLT
jgi:hypothetical protein